MRQQGSQDPRNNFITQDFYEAYATPNFRAPAGRRRKKFSNEQSQATIIATKNMLDTFTSLCVGDQHLNAPDALHEGRKYKYVICPRARYPTDPFESRQGVSQIQRKKVKQQIFRPVSQDDEFAHYHHRHR